VDKEVILALVNGPGTGLTLMALGFFALCFGVFLVKQVTGYNLGIEQGKAAAQRGALNDIHNTLKKMAFEQREMQKLMNFTPSPPEGEAYR
jgi:hypothetical protein